MNFVKIISWITENYFEITATLIGLTSIYFMIKEIALFWILGVINSAIFIFIYYNSGIFAYMILQIYYVIFNLYSFWYWTRKKQSKEPLVINNITKKAAFYIFISFIGIYSVVVLVLLKFTESDIPYIDAFISTTSIIAVYMLMKKYIESWYVWFITDLVTVFTLIEKKLFITITLYAFYMFFTLIGYLEWRKKLLKSKELFI
jgi:nicotinamide mononucleotide transporter